MDLTDDPLATIDADELEADIDKAIDELFVKKGEAPEPAVVEEAPTPEPAEEPVADPVPEPTEEPAPILSAELEDDPLMQLKENLLTLDWEISAENIQNFERELKVVSDKLGDDRHSMAVIKMGLGVLQYLRIAKGSAAPISIQFLHAATRGLDLFVREQAPTDAERNQVMDKLLGQFRRLKAEIQRMKAVAAPAAKAVAEPSPSEDPVLTDLVEEEPIVEEHQEEDLAIEELLQEGPTLEEPLEEELTLTDLAEEQPSVPEPPAEEPLLQEVPEDEPPLEDLLEEELTLTDLAEEEPIVEELREEDPAIEELLQEEPILEEPLEEELTLTDLAEEQPSVPEPQQEEPLLEEIPDDVPTLEEILEEEPVLEPPVEPTEVALAPKATSGESPSSLQRIAQEAKVQSSELTNALESLGQKTSDFFGGVIKAMAGKPALKKVEKHFGTVYKDMEVKLAEVKKLSANIGHTLAELEQNLGQQQPGRLTPDAQAEIDSQVKTIQDAVERFTQAAAHLRISFAGGTGAPAPSAEVEPHEDISLEADGFSLEPTEAMESLGSEPILELDDEIPAVDSDQDPSPAASIYLADVANNTLAIPTEAVANVFKISKRRAKAFRNRGYAKLADFKTAFRSIKRGITGPLADLKVKDLKKIQFPIITLSPEILGRDDTQADASVKGIVLLSNGESHGALFTDEIMQRTPYEIQGYRHAGLPGEVSGTAIIEGDFEINVIDPDYVLS